MTRFTYSPLRIPAVLPVEESDVYADLASCERDAQHDADCDDAPRFVYAHSGVGASWRFVREVEPTPPSEEEVAENARLLARERKAEERRERSIA